MPRISPLSMCKMVPDTAVVPGNTMEIEPKAEMGQENIPAKTVTAMLSMILRTVQDMETEMDGEFKRIESRIDFLESKLKNGIEAPKIEWPLDTLTALRNVEAQMVDPYFLKRLEIEIEKIEMLNITNYLSFNVLNRFSYEAAPAYYTKMEFEESVLIMKIIRSWIIKYNYSENQVRDELDTIILRKHYDGKNE